MSVSTLLLIILILILVGVFPAWPYSASWGFFPSSGVGVLLVIIIVLILLGRI